MLESPGVAVLCYGGGNWGKVSESILWPIFTGEAAPKVSWWEVVDIKVITRGKNRSKVLGWEQQPPTSEPPPGLTLEGLHLEEALPKKVQERPQLDSGRL